HAHDLPAAFDLLSAHRVDIILFDLSLLHLTGTYSFRHLVVAAAAAPIILLSRMEESNLAGELLRLGAQDCLIKGQFDADTLQRSILFSLQRKEKENELVQANERLHRVLQVSNDVIWEWDLQAGTVTRDEQRLQALFGLEPSANLDSLEEWMTRIHPDDRGVVQAVLQQVITNPRRDVYDVEYRLRRSDGTYIYVYDRGTVVRNSEGAVVRVIGAGQNITGRKQAEEKFRLIFNNSPLPTWVYEAGSLRFLEVNQAAIRTYGYSREEFLQLTGRHIRQSGQAAVLEEEVAEILHTGKEYRTRAVHVKKGGEVMAVAITAYPVDYFGKAAVLVQAQDITGEERLRRELETSRRQRQQEIMEAVMKAEEKERTSIGHELHDNINQILASAKLYVETALRAGADKDEYLRQGVHIIDVAIQEIRQLSKDLVATGFRHHGLVVAIQDITSLITTARGIHFQLCTEGYEDAALSEGHKLALYRIVQEQLNNIVKHARATEVQIELYTSEERVVLRIRDNGRGFDTSARPKGIGLSNIASRASFYNGGMEVLSAPGRGCELKVTLALGG
ncbi:MAG TPA: PAS domain-containing protein, partial [Candidatus Sulfotelmatobacter sp.]|nr:PAS domain-containing protein [Candidatus Sulfotelmatobacter sp.]